MKLVFCNNNCQLKGEGETRRDMMEVESIMLMDSNIKWTKAYSGVLTFEDYHHRDEIKLVFYRAVRTWRHRQKICKELGL